MSYAESKAALLARIAELDNEAQANDPKQHTERLRQQLKDAAASGADDDSLAQISQALQLAAAGADDVTIRHTVAASKKEAAERQLAELEITEAERIRKQRGAQLEKLVGLIPEAKQAYIDAFHNAREAHCHLAAILHRQVTIQSELTGIRPNGMPSAAAIISLPIPFGAERILRTDEVTSGYQDAGHREAFAAALASIDSTIGMMTP